MRRFAPLFAIAAIALVAVPVIAARHSQLRTFGDGEVTVEGTTAHIVNDAGEFGGVYLSPRRNATPIKAVDFSFVSTGDVAGGAPRFSIPIDTNHNHTVEGYAFLDVNGCGATTVSTDSATCTVFFQNEVFANWDAFARAHPKYRIPPGAIPFVIADQPGDYTVEEVDLR